MVGVEEGIISRSCLRDWNPQRLFSRHMVRSIPSTAPAPGNVSVLLTHCHSPLFLAFPFPPHVFYFFFSKEHLVLCFHPPACPSSTFLLSCTEKKHGGVDSETCFPNLFPPSCHADGRWTINQRGRAATWPDSRPWVGDRRAAPCH